MTLEALNEMEDMLYIAMQEMVYGDEAAKERFLTITRMLRLLGYHWRKDEWNGVIIY